MTRFLDWLLGPRCPLGCGQRVFPNELTQHLHVDHAGDAGTTSTTTNRKATP